jgi:hypothetical protein
MRERRVRLAVDIGGTFTDVVLDTGEKLVTDKLMALPSWARACTWCRRGAADHPDTRRRARRSAREKAQGAAA